MKKILVNRVNMLYGWDMERKTPLYAHVYLDSYHVPHRYGIECGIYLFLLKKENNGEGKFYPYHISGNDSSFPHLQVEISSCLLGIRGDFMNFFLMEDGYKILKDFYQNFLLPQYESAPIIHVSPSIFDNLGFFSLKVTPMLISQDELDEGYPSHLILFHIHGEDISMEEWKRRYKE